MRDEDKQQYLDMLPRVFVRVLRNTVKYGGDVEYELSEGEATDLLRRREEFNGGALFDALHLARNAIAAADEGAFGYGEYGHSKTPYPIKDELLTTIDAALEARAEHGLSRAVSGSELGGDHLEQGVAQPAAKAEE